MRKYLSAFLFNMAQKIDIETVSVKIKPIADVLARDYAVNYANDLMRRYLLEQGFTICAEKKCLNRN